jgi:hypothetical protein
MAPDEEMEDENENENNEDNENNFGQEAIDPISEEDISKLI